MNGRYRIMSAQSAASFMPPAVMIRFGERQRRFMSSFKSCGAGPIKATDLGNTGSGGSLEPKPTTWRG
jgi:hypothetical protein